MKTLEQLRNAGFTIDLDKVGESTISIGHTQLFWYFNPRFHTTPSGILNHIEATHPNGIHELTTTSFPGAPFADRQKFLKNSEFPFVILMDIELRRLSEMQQDREQLQKSIKQLNTLDTWMASKADLYIKDLIGEYSGN